MSQKTKRIYTAGVLSVLALGLLATAVLVWPVHVGPATAGEGLSVGSGQAKTSDAVAYSDMMRLRGALRLTDQTLAAAGVGQDEAESVLSKLLTWYEANAATWSARRGDVRRAHKALSVARHTLRTEGRNDALAARVPGMKTAIAAAEQAERTLLGGAVREVESALSDQQRVGWSAVRASPAGAGRYAYTPNVTAAQLAALNMAHWKLARQQATAATAAGRAAAKQAFARTLTNTLTAVQRQALSTAAANIRDHLPAVLAASREVLPHPPDDDPGVTVEPTR